MALPEGRLSTDDGVILICSAINLAVSISCPPPKYRIVSQLLIIVVAFCSPYLFVSCDMLCSKILTEMFLDLITEIAISKSGIAAAAAKSSRNRLTGISSEPSDELSASSISVCRS